MRAEARPKGGRVMIGRADDAHVRLLGEGVSRHHAELTRDKTGQWWIRDLKSSNGTLVNGFRIEHRMLDLNDRVQIGKYTLLIMDGGAGETLASSGTVKGDDVSITQDGSSSASASASASGKSSPAAPADGPQPRRRLGGYEIVRELGRGGMGAVYLARQLSLNRNIALKVMNPRWSDDPIFLANFTREAFAAAQLVHHNVVQIYDIGRQDRLAFFSMEFVDGPSLGQLVRKQGRLDPAEAAGYVLQAARGLAFAHEHGMIHRDIKPDNLLLNPQGIVKVADLGLIKTPESQQGAAPGVRPARDGPLTQQHVEQAMGTPAYMSPEQARDPAAADARSDVYSLGCTLHRLVTGRPLFEGTTPLEVMTRHAVEPVNPARLQSDGVPLWLCEVLHRMLAKSPGQRFQTMNELIAGVEDVLAEHAPTSGGKLDEHTPALRQAAAAFDGSPASKLPAIGLGLLAAATLGAEGYGVFAEDRRIMIAAAVAAIVGALCWSLVAGMMNRSPLFVRARRSLFKRFWFWLAGLLIVAAAAWGLIAIDLAWLGMQATVASALTAVAAAMALNTLAQRSRHGAIERVEQLLRRVRRRGIDEQAVQEWACRNGGEHWEALFEAVFGYEAKMSARRAWGGGRPRWGAWRDPLIAALDARQQSRTIRHQTRELAAIERSAARAQGADEQEASAYARLAAETMVVNALEFRQQTQPQPPAARQDAGGSTPASPPPRPVGNLAQSLLRDVMPMPVGKDHVRQVPAAPDRHVPAASSAAAPTASPAGQPDPPARRASSPAGFTAAEVYNQPTPALVDDEVKPARAPAKSAAAAEPTRLETIADQPAEEIDTLFVNSRPLQQKTPDDHGHAKRTPIPFWVVVTFAGLSIGAIILWIAVAVMIFKKGSGAAP